MNFEESLQAQFIEHPKHTERGDYCVCLKHGSPFLRNLGPDFLWLDRTGLWTSTRWPPLRPAALLAPLRPCSGVRWPIRKSHSPVGRGEGKDPCFSWPPARVCGEQSVPRLTVRLDTVRPQCFGCCRISRRGLERLRLQFRPLRVLVVSYSENLIPKVDQHNNPSCPVGCGRTCASVDSARALLFSRTPDYLLYYSDFSLLPPSMNNSGLCPSTLHHHHPSFSHLSPDGNQGAQKRAVESHTAFIPTEYELFSSHLGGAPRVMADVTISLLPC